jgi:uncharacterized protein (TIGR03437 family)
MRWEFYLRVCAPLLLSACLAVSPAPGRAATFGQPVAIGGHAADLALDESRGVLYVANFTANRVDVVSLSSAAVETSFNVASQPSSVSISPSGQYLLVGHYGNFEAPGSPVNGLTLINLETRARQTVSLGAPVLGVAFGADGLALVVTNTEFLLFDPATTTTRLLDTIANLTARSLPVDAGNLPPDITTASIATSADGNVIYGLGGADRTFTFRYDVLSQHLGPGGITLASGVLGPRVVSLNRDGTRILAGWVLIDERGALVSYFKNRTNQFSVGSTAIDSQRGIIYAQIPERQGEAPLLQLLDADNLTVLEKLRLPENLTGKSLLSRDGSMLYSISESGVTFLPVGFPARAPRLQPSAADLVFRGSVCERRATVQEFDLTDPGGNRTSFSIRVTTPGVTVQPASGTTPARIRVTVDPAAFARQKGTVAVPLTIDSTMAVNLVDPVRLLINFRDPDQRGTFVNVPGKLVDILADPDRNRFYVLRQDRNQVLVFDGDTKSQLATLKTYNSPTSLAMTLDARYLLVGHDAAQVAAVFDLDTLTPEPYISTAGEAGTEARYIAVSAGAILAAAVDFEGKGRILRLDLATRTAFQFPTLGVYKNEVHPATVAVGSGSGSSVLFASPDGQLLLYNASAGTFTVSRKEPTALSGAIAASNFDTFAVGNNLLNASLVPTVRLDASFGAPSGFVFVGPTAIRTIASAPADPGIAQRLDLAASALLRRATRIAEAPLAPTTQQPFTRTLAYLPASRSLVSLSVSGFVVLPWTYDEAVAPPRLARIVNAADQSTALAPGSLVSIYGEALSPLNIATQEIPLPTALGESCLTVNGLPIPMLFVSPAQINAQLPFTIEGNATLVLYTPGGVSDTLNLRLQPAAPAVFRNYLRALDQEVATVIRERNGELVTLSNPIHRGDRIQILLAGMGRTLPAAEAGVPAPAQPPALAILAPEVTLGGVPLGVEFAGLVPGQVGVYAIRATTPGFVPVGVDIPLTIRQAGQETTVSVRVVDK